jgi:hypothetical protein
MSHAHSARQVYTRRKVDKVLKDGVVVYGGGRVHDNMTPNGNAGLDNGASHNNGPRAYGGGRGNNCRGVDHGGRRNAPPRFS